MVTVRPKAVFAVDSVFVAPRVPSRRMRSPPRVMAELKVLLRNVRLRRRRSTRSFAEGWKASAPEALENTRSSPSVGAVPPQLPAKLQVEDVALFCQVSVAAGASAPALAATPSTRVRSVERGRLEGSGRGRIGKAGGRLTINTNLSFYRRAGARV
jgi:hypothetical protein